MCKAGINGEILDSTVQDLTSSLTAHPALPERLCIHLAFQQRFRKSNPLSRRLLRQFRIDFDRSIGYDPADFGGYRAERSIEQWASHKGAQTPDEIDTWIRRAIVALLDVTDDTARATGLFTIVREWLSTSRKVPKPELVFIQALISALSTPRINRNKLLTLYSGVQMVERERREILDRERSLQMTIKGHQDAVRLLEERVAALSEEVKVAKNESRSKDQNLATRDSELSALNDKMNLLDRHWEGVAEQQLAKQAGTLRAKIQHELQEALLALDREDPNVQMALNRLRRIEGIVKD